MDEVTRRYLLEQAEEELKAIWKRTEYLNNEDIEWQFSFLKRKKFIFVPRTGRGCANPLSRKSSVLARRHVPYRLLCTELDEGPEDHDYCQSATFSGFPPEAQDEAMRHVFLSRDAERKVAVDVETIDETEQKPVIIELTTSELIRAYDWQTHYGFLLEPDFYLDDSSDYIPDLSTKKRKKFVKRHPKKVKKSALGNSHKVAADSQKPGKSSPSKVEKTSHLDSNLGACPVSSSVTDASNVVTGSNVHEVLPLKTPEESCSSVLPGVVNNNASVLSDNEEDPSTSYVPSGVHVSVLSDKEEDPSTSCMSSRAPSSASVSVLSDNEEDPSTSCVSSVSVLSDNEADHSTSCVPSRASSRASTWASSRASRASGRMSRSSSRASSASSRMSSSLSRDSSASSRRSSSFSRDSSASFRTAGSESDAVSSEGMSSDAVSSSAMDEGELSATDSHFDENPKGAFGNLGFEKGMTWVVPNSLHKSGCHPSLDPIDYGPKGVYSLVLSDPAEAKDYGDRVLYNGLSSTIYVRNRKKKRLCQKRVQQMKGGNQALMFSMLFGEYLRLLRSYTLRSPFSPKFGTQYGGLFFVNSAISTVMRDRSQEFRFILDSDSLALSCRGVPKMWEEFPSSYPPPDFLNFGTPTEQLLGTNKVQDIIPRTPARKRSSRLRSRHSADLETRSLRSGKSVDITSRRSEAESVTNDVGLTEGSHSVKSYKSRKSEPAGVSHSVKSYKSRKSEPAGDSHSVKSHKSRNSEPAGDSHSVKSHKSRNSEPAEDEHSVRSCNSGISKRSGKSSVKSRKSDTKKSTKSAESEAKNPPEKHHRKQTVRPLPSDVTPLKEDTFKTTGLDGRFPYVKLQKLESMNHLHSLETVPSSVSVNADATRRRKDLWQQNVEYWNADFNDPQPVPDPQPLPEPQSNADLQN